MSPEVKSLRSRYGRKALRVRRSRRRMHGQHLYEIYDDVQKRVLSLWANETAAREALPDAERGRRTVEWRDGTVRKIAQAIVANNFRDHTQFGILADAMEEAGWHGGRWGNLLISAIRERPDEYWTQMHIRDMAEGKW